MRILKKSVLPCLVLLFLGACLSAQDIKNNQLSYSYYPGKSVGRTSALESNFTESFGIGFQKKLNPEAYEWVEKLNAQSMGVEIIYTDMEGIRRNYDYGKSIGALWKIDFGLLKSENFALLLSPGIGLTYVTETTRTHPTTFIFGSHLNGLFTGALQADYQISEDWKVGAKVAFLHYSNGSFRLPNAGVNLLNVGVGIAKNLEGKSFYPNQVRDSAATSERKHFAEISAAFGQRGKYQQNSAFYRYAFYAGYRYELNPVIALRLGSDVVYIPQVYNPVVYQDSVPYLGASYDHFRVGASLGAELVLNKFAFNFNFGRYIHLDGPYGQKTYWNSSLKYYVIKNFGVQGTLHANKVQADFIGWGIFVKL